jgi:hypothetical protein
MGGPGRQADRTAGLPPAPEMPVRADTFASCHEPTFPREIDSLLSGQLT